MSEPKIQVVIENHWLSTEFLIGDLTMSTIWPGGSDELSWTGATAGARRFTGGEAVTGYYCGVPVFAGSLLEPDLSQDQLVAQGAWREGDNYDALNSSLVPTPIPDTAVTQAISRGLRWTMPVSIRSTAFAIDTSIPITVGAILDTWTQGNTLNWYVDPYRQVFAVAQQTAPTYQVMPIDGGLGYATDDYASTLFGRYLDSTTSTFLTATATDATALALHGRSEQIVDITSRGAISAAGAVNILTSLLALGKSTPQWTSDIEVSYGELLSMGGVPVALETVAAGSVVRVHGGFELAQRQNGAMWIDVLIGQTKLSGGTLTLQPYRRATRTYQDFVTDAASKSAR